MVLDVQWNKELQTVQIANLGYTIQSSGTFSNLYATDVNGDLFGYESLQFHFHSPSEHEVEGKQYDLEMHIVHELKPEFSTSNAKRTHAVLSILFDLTSTGTQPFFDTYKFSGLEAQNTTAQVNISSLLGSQIDENPIYYTYKGSLTTPRI